MKEFIRKYKVGRTLLVILVILAMEFHSIKTNRDYDFNGIVQNINYDIKKIPTVTINGSNYYLGGRYLAFYKYTIQIGDKLMKKKGDDNVYLIKNNTKDTINLYYGN